MIKCHIKKYINYLLFLLFLFVFNQPVYADSIQDQLNFYKNKLKNDIEQLRLDQKKIELDKQIIKQDRLQIMRLNEEIMRNKIKH